MNNGIITDAMARHEMLLDLGESTGYRLLEAHWQDELRSAKIALLNVDATNPAQVARVQMECHVLLRVLDTLSRLIGDARAEFEREGESV